MSSPSTARSRGSARSSPSHTDSSPAPQTQPRRWSHAARAREGGRAAEKRIAGHHARQAQRPRLIAQRAVRRPISPVSNGCAVANPKRDGAARSVRAPHRRSRHPARPQGQRPRQRQLHTQNAGRGGRQPPTRSRGLHAEPGRCRRRRRGESAAAAGIEKHQIPIRRRAAAGVRSDHQRPSGHQAGRAPRAALHGQLTSAPVAATNSMAEPSARIGVAQRWPSGDHGSAASSPSGETRAPRRWRNPARPPAGRRAPRAYRQGRGHRLTLTASRSGSDWRDTADPAVYEPGRNTACVPSRSLVTARCGVGRPCRMDSNASSVVTRRTTCSASTTAISNVR